MTDPPPIKAKENPNTSPENVDYSYTTPLSSSGSDFPCKGYLSLLVSPEAKPVDTWNAGNSYSVTISGHAVHGGGSCQISLSVDGGSSFKVLRSFIGGCPRGDATQLDFRLPGDTPSSDHAVLAWTWFNNLGNREMYMNCAVISVAGEGGGEGHGESFNKRPEIFKANVGNGCRTADSRDVMIPNPGPDVEVNNSDAVPPIGECESGPGAAAGSDSGPGSRSGGTGGIYKPGNDWPADFNPNSARIMAHDQDARRAASRIWGSQECGGGG
ncbi:extracellular protein [Colletotrichum fioriniae PJ7]|uniref:Extracellular protein n=1 Tax=Colletotrichum fioriniae PJ7 TaxID=1445577 RepID=A0A010SDT7_9PEZI|nr:extracellular protein [Colletotrichum fioriniae PJ7]